MVGLESLKWDPAELRRHAAGFSMDIFHARLKETVVSTLTKRGLTDIIAEIEKVEA